MKQSDVFSSALWLGSDDDNSDAFYILRGKFSVSKVKKATLRVLGLGFFHCYINGRRVGDDLFLPLTTDYEARKNFPSGEILSGHRIYVPEYDVTEMIREGENVIAIHFGGGWYTYNHPIENFKDSDMRFGKPKAIWRIFGEEKNGSFEAVSSEEDILLPGFIKNYYMPHREYQDYFLNSEDAFLPHFDNSAFPKAKAVTPPRHHLSFHKLPERQGVRNSAPRKDSGKRGIHLV